MIDRAKEELPIPSISLDQLKCWKKKCPFFIGINLRLLHNYCVLVCVSRNKDTTGAYDLGDLDQALFLYLEAQDNHHSSSVQDQRQNSGTRPTLNIFPSQPMHVEPSPKESAASFVSPSSSGSKRPSETSMELANQRNEAASGPEPTKVVKREGNRKGPTSSSEHEGPKTPDPKTLRRLAQNREAARKSRLRKKAYVQQLETSRIKLTQLEQELQRARSQGVFFGGGGLVGDQALKSMVVKSDVFHLVSGMWKTPAERCFLWMGGFRPFDIIKIILNHIEPMTEQQILAICSLQQSTQEAEDALNQGLDALYQSLSDTIASDTLNYPSNMGNYMGQMAMAMNKLSTLEGFVRQADNLRHQTLHRLHQILTTRQAARCFLAMAEYFHRLRSLSSLWLSRPRQE
ncbi:Transcription factor tgal4 [Thalictrum thalictroides]|uniref:Transcription factor tgal4 n=1 Tax=Thalictrum thalictroides TaxID=46969 RepID=A0A7J6W2X8_THATH|nr:Transcription factor tgal4 [Thalictrum thalictroides]